MSRVLACLVMWGVMSGCSATPEGTASRLGRLELREGQSVADAPVCGVELPGCEADRTCVAFTLEGVPQARCLKTESLCTELLGCTGGSVCTLMESYPVRVACTGRCEGPDCDSPASSPAP